MLESSTASQSTPLESSSEGRGWLAGRMSTAYSSGTRTSSKTTSWLQVARMPRWSQVSSMRMPGVSRCTSQVPTRGSASSLRAHTESQVSPGMPVE